MPIGIGADGREGQLLADAGYSVMAGAMSDEDMLAFGRLASPLPFLR